MTKIIIFSILAIIILSADSCPTKLFWKPKPQNSNNWSFYKNIYKNKTDLTIITFYNSVWNNSSMWYLSNGTWGKNTIPGFQKLPG